MSGLVVYCDCVGTARYNRRLDSQIEKWLSKRRDEGFTRAVSADSPAHARSQYEKGARLPEGAQVPLINTEELTVNGDIGPLPARLYLPGRHLKRDGLIVYFHGGGWVLGSVQSHDALCRQLAVSAGMSVLSVEYRLAPEAPFPAAVNDADAVVAYLRADSAIKGMSRGAVVLAGDSAGANLVAAVVRRIRDRCEPQVDLQVLLYPVTEYEFSRRSSIDNGSGFYLTLADMAWFWHHYLPDSRLAVDPDASPSAASDLSGLPSTIMVTAGFDLLHDQAVAYAHRLGAAGVAVNLKCYQGAIHGFMRNVSLFDVAVSAVEWVGYQIQASVNINSYLPRGQERWTTG